MVAYLDLKTHDRGKRAVLPSGRAELRLWGGTAGT